MTDHADLIARLRGTIADEQTSREISDAAADAIEALEKEAQDSEHDLRHYRDQCLALQKRVGEAQEYAIKLQRLLENLRHDSPTPYPELHHHGMVVEIKAERDALQAEVKGLRGIMQKMQWPEGEREEAMIVSLRTRGYFVDRGELQAKLAEAERELAVRRAADRLPRSGAYGVAATCKHGVHPFDCTDGCDPHRVIDAAREGT